MKRLNTLLQADSFRFASPKAFVVPPFFREVAIVALLARRRASLLFTPFAPLIPAYRNRQKVTRFGSVLFLASVTFVSANNEPPADIQDLRVELKEARLNVDYDELSRLLERPDLSVEERIALVTNWREANRDEIVQMRMIAERIHAASPPVMPPVPAERAVSESVNDDVRRYRQARHELLTRQLEALQDVDLRDPAALSEAKARWREENAPKIQELRRLASISEQAQVTRPHSDDPDFVQLLQWANDHPEGRAYVQERRQVRAHLATEVADLDPRERSKRFQEWRTKTEEGLLSLIETLD